MREEQEKNGRKLSVSSIVGCYERIDDGFTFQKFCLLKL